jgi:hypothetical protein
VSRPGVLAIIAVRSAAAEVVMEPFATQVRSVGDIPDVPHDTSLLGQSTLLTGVRRFGEEHVLCFIVDAHRLTG